MLPSPCKVSTSPEPHTLVAHCPPPLPSDPAFIMAPIANVDDGLSGETRTFTCLSGGSNREISFYFNGVKLEEGVSGDTLTIPSTTTANTGVYQCIVENDSGTDGTSWYLIVRDPSEWSFVCSLCLEPLPYTSFLSFTKHSHTESSVKKISVFF